MRAPFIDTIDTLLDFIPLDIIGTTQKGRNNLVWSPPHKPLKVAQVASLSLF